MTDISVLASKITDAQKKHGLDITRTYNHWVFMHSCAESDPDEEYCPHAHDGIQVCDRWNTFDNFVKDMGKQPDWLYLGVVDKSGIFEKDNCKWMTLKDSEAGAWGSSK